MSSGVIEVGPGEVRELCCGTYAELAKVALDGIDDPVVLVDDRPMPVDSVWEAVLRSLECADRDTVFVVHPSWWTSARIAVIRTAAQSLGNNVVLQPRSWLLAQAAPKNWARPTVVVEIAERLVVIAHSALQAEPRCGEPQRVAEAVMQLITGFVRPVMVVVDAPGSVPGADTLATMIVDGLAAINGMTVVQVDDARLRQLAVKASSAQQNRAPHAESVKRPRHRRALMVSVALIAMLVGLGAFNRHHTTRDRVATTFLVEGRVAVEVPASWTVQRVTSGPGSARVQVTSPSDPQLALHVTQSPVGPEAPAESLKRAIDAEPPNVFVDFNPSGSSAGRPALTYREVRAGHDIRWAVIVDKAIRIAIGCQSHTGADDAVREACERAVRSAHALD